MNPNELISICYSTFNFPANGRTNMLLSKSGRCNKFKRNTIFASSAIPAARRTRTRTRAQNLCVHPSVFGPVAVLFVFNLNESMQTITQRTNHIFAHFVPLKSGRERALCGVSSTPANGIPSQLRSRAHSSRVGAAETSGKMHTDLSAN